MSQDVSELGDEALAKLKGQLEAEVEEEEKKETAWDKMAKGKMKTEPEPTSDEAEEIRRQKKSRIAQILTRGILNEKLQTVFDASIPKDWGGKFVRDEDGSIIWHKNLGFDFIYKEGATTLHDSPDGRVRVGDLVLMSINPEDRAILKEAKAEGVQHKLGAGRREYHRQAENVRTGASSYDDSQQSVHKPTR